MPRLSPSLIKRAYQIDTLLPRLLWECRDLESARNELRWLREHVQAQSRSHLSGTGKIAAGDWLPRLRKMVDERSRGKPLQYILGDQPFGDLDILCRKGVLIPRPETESYTIRTARWILTRLRRGKEGAESGRTAENPLRILDLCTGTGCIPLLLHSLLTPHIPHLQIVGVDISDIALSLARENLKHNVSKGKLSEKALDDVQFIKADVLSSNRRNTAEQPAGRSADDCPHSPDQRLTPEQTFLQLSPTWNILISNPPYISPLAYANGTTRRSVKLYEPKLALVPPPHLHGPPFASQIASASSLPDPAPTRPEEAGDAFYPILLALSEHIRADLTVLECGDPPQAARVVSLARQSTASNEPTRTSTRTKVGTWRCDAYEDTRIAYRDEELLLDDDAPEDGGARAVVVIRG